MEVNAPQSEESTPRRQEDVKVDPWDLYVQAYQWADQEVSKGKLSSRKAASEVYLRFGINLLHTACAKAAEDEGAPPKKRGKATFVPLDVESKLVDFCIALRSLNFPIFKEELIGYCNTLIQGTKLVSLFKHGEVRDSWYYNWLRRCHERLGTAAAKPLEGDRELWTTSKNVGKHYQILEKTFVDLGFAVNNPSYSADEPLSESIKFHPWALGRIVSFDESRFQLDMTDGDKNTPCVRATGYCRAMAQCALQNYSVSIARAMARGLGFVTPCPNEQGKNAYFSKLSDASGTACDAVNVREDCKHFGPPLWVVPVEERGPFGGPS